MPITLLEVAKARGARPGPDGSITMAEFDEAGIPMLAGCQCCGASLAAYNGYPSQTGFVRCKDCIGDLGFETPAEFEAHLSSQEPDDLFNGDHSFG